ncbi:MULTISPECIES: hypothetical protein [Pseudomonas]|uniref:hypothetical protein n=1 Tax=Pseudomonas TaxID=286 RepID=UPI0009304766|nr:MULTISPECIES: hypothetical protein [Pseudomonas]
MADDWLEREVIAGLMGLVALRLDGAPAADAITLTLDIWLVALKKAQRWNEEQDSGRVKSAFETLFANCERWPAPASLIRELPVRQGQQTLPKPALTDQQRANGRRRIGEILDGLKHGNTKLKTNMEHQKI